MSTNSFLIRADATSQTGLKVITGVALAAGIGLLVTAAFAEHILGFLIYGTFGVLYALYMLYAMYSAKYLEYEDGGDHIRISFGPGSLFNCMMKFCGTLTTHTSGRIDYADIGQVQYLESTNCCDGCGVYRNYSRDVIYATDCCVPAVEIRSSNADCCFSGRTLIGVRDEEQAQELILGINNKIGANTNAIV